MTSVERVHEYSLLPLEEQLDDDKIDDPKVCCVCVCVCVCWCAWIMTLYNYKHAHTV